MAQEDYLSGSAFGQVAGSLLASNKKRDKKERNKALLATVLFETLGALQLNQKQKIVDGSNDVKDKYEDIFTNNEEIYSRKDTARGEYRKYAEDPNAFIESKAMQLFNEDSTLIAELGTNPYSKLTSNDLTQESFEQAQAVLDSKRKLAKEYIEAQQKNPAVTMSTLTKFNQKAKAEYRAALAQVEDDPYKQGLIKSAFAKLFGGGAKAEAELTASLSKAEQNRLAQDSLVDASETINFKINKKNQSIVDANKELEGTPYFDYVTKKEQIIRNSKVIKEKIETGKFTDDDVIEAYRLGVAPSNIKELTELQENDIGDFVKVFTKVRAITDRELARDPKQTFVDPSDYLSTKERDIYDVAMGIKRDDIDPLTKIQDPRLRASVVSNILNTGIVEGSNDRDILGLIQGNFGVDDTGQKDVSTGQSSQFVSNVIRGATVLQNKYDMNEIQAINESYKLQLDGISEGTGSGTEEVPGGRLRRITTFEKQTNTVEYVNPDVEALPILPETALQIAQNINDYKYIQKNTSYIDEDGQTQNLVPSKGKEYTPETYKGADFEITFTAKERIPGSGIYEWTPNTTYISQP
tara:strand:+ start:336 stop:2078 length:1743 start_codon:yes stop_codon:yes gene_type:complete